MTLKSSGGNGSALAWIKSSYSSDEGADCVEVAWHKSTYSSDEGGECVEVATTPGTVLIRDSKNPDGPRLTIAPTTWAAFLPYAAEH